jgi:predicted PurR-regulated permease PerM
MSTDTPVRQSLLTVGIAFGALLLWMLRDLAMLVGFAALLAYALDPLVSLVERVRLPRIGPVPRGVAAGIVVVALVVVAAWALAAAVPRLAHDVTRFVEAAPGALATLEAWVRRHVEQRGWGAMLGSGGSGADQTAAVFDKLRGAALGLLGGVFSNLGQLAGLVLLPVLALYLLADADAVQTSALRFVPKEFRPQAMRFLRAVDPALRAYVRGQSLVCLIMGTALAIILQLLGFPVALLLGVVVGVAEVVPFLGFWIAAIAIVLAGFTTGPALAAWGLASYIAVNNLMGYFVTPRLLGHEVKMHPFVVTLSILGGTALLGPAGGILALPTAAMLQAVIEEFGPPSTESTP